MSAVVRPPHGTDADTVHWIEACRGERPHAMLWLDGAWLCHGSRARTTPAQAADLGWVYVGPLAPPPNARDTPLLAPVSA